MDAFEAQQAVVGPIYSIADIFKDPQYIARDTITTVDDPRLGHGAHPERDPAPDAHARAGSATSAATWARTTSRSWAVELGHSDRRAGATPGGGHRGRPAGRGAAEPARDGRAADQG